MKKKLMTALLPFYVLTACTSPSNHLLKNAREAGKITTEETTSTNFQTFLKGVHGFSARFTKNLCLEEDDKKENLASSPLSVYFALLMASKVTDGNTKDEILKVLNVKDDEKLNDDVRILYGLSQKEDKTEEKDVFSLKQVLANSIWFDKSIQLKDGILDKLSDEVFASSFDVNFKGDIDRSNKVVSEYVKKMTNGMIDKNFNFPSSTDILLMNTLYLKTIWDDDGNDLSFSKDTYTFVNRDNSKKDMKLMYLPASIGKVLKGDGYSSYQAVSSGNISLRFILPDEGKNLEDVMDEKTLTEVCQADYQGLDEENKKKYITKCYFPEFTGFTDTEVSPVLQKMGVHNLFSSDCDTTPLTDKKMTCDGIEHVAKLEVTRKGVEGSAVTVTHFTSAIGPGPKIYDEIYEDFIVDRAFGYVVLDRDGIPLFSGVTNTIR